MIFGKGMFSTSKEVQLDMDTYLLYNDPETSLLYYRTTQSQTTSSTERSDNSGLHFAGQQLCSFLVIGNIGETPEYNAIKSFLLKRHEWIILQFKMDFMSS